MQYKDTSQQVFLIMYLICIHHLFTFHLVDLGEFLICKVGPHTKVLAPLT